MKHERKTGRCHDRLNVLVRCFKFVIWALVIVYLLCIAIDHNQINEMKKEELRLSIKLLKVELGL